MELRISHAQPVMKLNFAVSGISYLAEVEFHLSLSSGVQLEQGSVVVANTGTAFCYGFFSATHLHTYVTAAVSGTEYSGE